MKKIMSVIILLAFLGSTIVMTGCLDGSDGVGAIIGAAFVIAIIASAGTTAAPAFAANVRGEIRPAISLADPTANINMVVFPLDSTGAKVGTGVKVTGVTFDDTTKELKANYTPSTNDGYNQYLIEVRSNNNLLLKGIKYLKDSEKAPNTTKTAEVTATSTAKVFIYENWNTSATSRTYETFEFNLGGSTADVKSLAASINSTVVDNTNPDYSAVESAATTEAEKVSTNPIMYSISGFVTAGDGQTGSSGTTITLTRKSDGYFIDHTTTAEGNFSLRIYDGEYVLTPTKADHTFTPASTTVTINGANVTDINFRAAPSSFAANQR
jgi:hypothetical protein